MHHLSLISRSPHSSLWSSDDWTLSSFSFVIVKKRWGSSSSDECFDIPLFLATWWINFLSSLVRSGGKEKCVRSSTSNFLKKAWAIFCLTLISWVRWKLWRSNSWNTKIIPWAMKPKIYLTTWLLVFHIRFWDFNNDRACSWKVCVKKKIETRIFKLSTWKIRLFRKKKLDWSNYQCIFYFYT